MKKYIKKQVVVEAIQWDGTLEKALEISQIDGLNSIIEYYSTKTVIIGESTFSSVNTTEEIKSFKIKTLEGDMNVSKGDYIIKGIKGEFYPCKEDIFKKTYVDFTEYVGADELLADLDNTLESIENNLKSFLPDAVHVEYLSEVLPVIRGRIKGIYSTTIK